MAEKRPFDVLNNSLGNSVLIRMKSNFEIRGTLSSFDVHMNLVLENAEELVDGDVKRKVGTLLVRGDTIIYVSPA
ncbi:small nuclear ribonucleoprotein [Candidatus Micrarchaeota archaeon]|nr:small nuclear ribonucleoprotein [Candidatus Micrarchaeota archaeon]